MIEFKGLNCYQNSRPQTYKENPSLNLNYKEAGVDVEAGDRLVDWLRLGQKVPKHLKMRQKQVMGGIGGFAALYKAQFSGMKKPVLVTCTDGVGTKVLLASQFKQFAGVGQDLVAMCVNDLICTGGEPLMFLDYYACGKLQLEDAKQFLGGVRQACHDSGAILIGGETAEMPGVYQPGHFDCAGFAVGVVDEAKTLGPKRVKAGDVIVAVASSGFHSNGYSLLRKVFADDIEKWKDILLMPTALYVEFARRLKKVKGLKALAHITGGGMDNIPRVLPKGLRAQLQPWTLPMPFMEVKKRTQMSWADLLGSLNCGIGLAVIIDRKSVKATLLAAKKSGFAAWEMGYVIAQKPKSAEADWQLDLQLMETKNRER